MQSGLLRPPFPIPYDARRGLARPEDCVSVISAPCDLRNPDGNLTTTHTLVEIPDADWSKAKPYCTPESDVSDADRAAIARAMGTAKQNS